MINKIQRSRLKMTLFGIVLLLISLWPILRIIEKKMDNHIFNLEPEIMGYLGILSLIGAIIGYYTNRETTRPSLEHNTYVNVEKSKDYRELAGEDESDPGDIPL